MLQKWKQILTNWNNCYFIGNIKDEPKITVESLITIISHLRQNYNLDESKSSVLEANTVREFILEKYPEFKFENGTDEPRNEEEVYMVASLLLFFVCVNSKDVDIKNAMCSKLSSEDQEIILKFSKGLMECSAISYRDVQATIAEACGQDVGVMEVSQRFTVAETPPALRSLHSEVRRLQAALEAERFDRTYLQEELTRTNARVDKLLKEKEQYKLDIVNLKAKIALCGDESEIGGAKADDCSITLTRQLRDLEERLGDMQGRLDDAEYQRDTFKAKVDELKHERDKWLALHQEETSRTLQLYEQLEHEKRQNNSLQELLTELRQHNKRNGLDSSSLECDDPDSSIQSLPHNASVCSEVCANVVEVQLGEERAKIVLLQQQIRTLQDQISEVTKKAEAEKLALKDEVAERDHNIFNLKHRINEEIEDKIKLKQHYDNEITRLNNAINELELNLKDNNDHLRAVIDKKMQEIQTLQEEKLIILQSLDSEKTKHEKAIKDLKAEIDTEKQSKYNMKDSYENHLMKLNEKVLKRNNELVEFQNNICEKSEMIESLQVQLKKEKEAAIALKDYCTSLGNQKIATENELKQNMQKINELQKNLQVRNTNIEDLNIEISNLKSSVSDISADYKDLEAIRDKLVLDVKNRDDKVEESIKEIEKIKEIYSKEKEKIILDLDERSETVNSLQLQLKTEIDFKIELQKEIPQMRAIKATLTEKLEKLDSELTHLKSEIENNERTIDAMDLYITEEKKSNEQANIKIQQMSDEITSRENDIEKLKNQLDSVNLSLQEESKKRYEVLSELEPLTEQVKCLCNDNIQLEKEVAAKCQEILVLKVDVEVLSNQLKEKETMMEQSVKYSTIKFNDLQQHSQKLEKSLKDYKVQTSATLKESENEIETLKNEIIVNNNNLQTNAEKFKALHNFSEDLLRSWQTYKNDTIAHLNEKDAEIINLKNKVLLLEQQLIETEQKNEELFRKIMDIQSSNDHIEIILSTEKGARVVLESEKEKVLQENTYLVQQLIEEKQSKEIVGKEIDILSQETKILEDRLLEQENAKAELRQLLDVFTQANAELKESVESEAKKNLILMKEKELLNNDLELSKANHQYLMEENKDLSSDNENMSKQLEEISAVQTSLIEMITILNEKKKSFLNSLETQIQKVDMLETGKACLQSQVHVFNTDVCKLNDACKDLKEELGNEQAQCEDFPLQLKKQKEDMSCLQNTIEKRFETFIQESDFKIAVLKENEMILTENLNKRKQEQEKLLRENETLETELHSVKSLRYAAESEKNNLEKKICELEIQYEEKNGSLNKNINENIALCNKTTENLINKEKELLKTDAAYKQLKTEHESVQQINSLISDTVSAGLNKLLLKFKNQDLNNPVLQKLANKDCEDIKLSEKCSLIVNIANVLVSETENLKNLEISLKKENLALVEMQDSLKQKEMDIFELKTEINRLQKIVNENKIELSKQKETYSTSMESKIKDIQSLQHENQTLHNDLNDVKVQLEVKVHSLKEKLVDNENLTDKLKKTYEFQIDNLNVMITKLTNYLKDKTQEIDTLRKDKEQLNETLKDNREAIKSLEDEVKIEKQNINKLISDFYAERQVLKNMVTVTESVMDDQKTSLNNTISEYLKAKEALQDEVCQLTKALDATEKKYQDIELASESILSLLMREREVKSLVEKESETVRQYFDELVNEFKMERNTNKLAVITLASQNKELTADLEKSNNDLECQQKKYNELQTIKVSLENEIKTKSDVLTKVMLEVNEVKKTLEDKNNNLIDKQTALTHLMKEKEQIKLETSERQKLVSAELELCKVKLTQLTTDNHNLIKIVDEYKIGLAKLEHQIKQVQEEKQKAVTDIENEKISLINKCSTFQNYQEKANQFLEERQNDIVCLQKEMETLQVKLEIVEQDCKDKDGLISKMSKEKDAVISTISKELMDEKCIREKCEKELENQKTLVHELQNNMAIRALKKENEQLIRAIGQQETFAAMCQEKFTVEKYQQEHRDHHQVDNISSDNTQSSMESLKTITDLEKIIHDKNRTITTLQQDITYLKSLMAESENKLLDVTKELTDSKENYQQLSSQLKKMISHKNEEITDLQKQLDKMSVTENRATQIIKVSAKYQAIILRRIAEIKSNTILKELTNFGNTNNCDKDLRLSLNAGTVTMEDLENFLETTDRHLKRCSEKQITLQKERDRLAEVNRIHESEIINLRKFLTELSVSFQTFLSVKDMYAQKLSRIISVQRTARREILNLESRINDATMCKLERGYAAVMQDLSECAMNLERWVERCISRTVSVEKIKQAFTSDSDRSSLSSPSFQNTGLEIQLDELEKSFQKLLEEVARALKGDGAKDAQSTTVMEVRAEYEDKLNRMKAKMKELFNEQMAVLKEKQRGEIALLERELQKTRESKEDSKLEYEKYIRQLTKELWSAGEKYLVKNDEAEWLRKKQRSGSLMSLQHVHSSGLIPPPEPPSRPSDASSLRSLPVTNNSTKRETRQMHMSDEEGELFDNRFLKELTATPRRDRDRDLPPGQRLSELKWRNSLCPPHLKSSYPAETQFAPALDEEDLKTGVAVPAKSQRKEVGITAYKKPGPPTPSKQAGRLSATGSDLRESLRVDSEPLAERKTSTPSRLRSFLRLNKNDTGEGTPRTRRLSNIFRKNR